MDYAFKLLMLPLKIWLLNNIEIWHNMSRIERRNKVARETSTVSIGN